MRAGRVLTRFAWPWRPLEGRQKTGVGVRFRCPSMEARSNPRLRFPSIRADAPPKGARFLNPTRDSRSLAHKLAEPCARPSGPCAQASEPCGRGCTALRPSLPIPAHGSPSLAHESAEPCAQALEPRDRGCNARKAGKSPRHARHQLVKGTEAVKRLDCLRPFLPFLHSTGWKRGGSFASRSPAMSEKKMDMTAAVSDGLAVFESAVVRRIWRGGRWCSPLSMLWRP